jgi:hypothetical protein
VAGTETDAVTQRLHRHAEGAGPMLAAAVLARLVEQAPEIVAAVLDDIEAEQQ